MGIRYSVPTNQPSRRDRHFEVTPVTGFPFRRGQDGSMKAIETSLLGDPIVVPHETTLELYRKMLTVFFVEERMKIFVKQGKCSFNASTRGRHDQPCAALGMGAIEQGRVSASLGTYECLLVSSREPAIKGFLRPLPNLARSLSGATPMEQVKCSLSRI